MDDRSRRAGQIKGGGAAREDVVEPATGGSGDGSDWLDSAELDAIGDLGTDFDDTEGWMSERAGYWEGRACVSVLHPTRASLLRHRLAEAVRLLRPPSVSHGADEPAEPGGESVWIAAMRDLLGHDVIGPDGGEIRNNDDWGGQ